MAGLPNHNYDVATEQECLDDLNELTEDLSWQYQLDDLDKLISKAQDIENIAKRLKELKSRKSFAIRELKDVQYQIMNDRLQLSNYLVNRIKELGGAENE